MLFKGRLHFLSVLFLRRPGSHTLHGDCVISTFHGETDYSLEGLMLKLKLQSFGYLTQRADSFEKTLMLGKIEGKRRRGCQKTRWLDGITDSMDMSFEQTPGDGEGQGSLACCSL